MADIQVWADDPVTCKVKLKGIRHKSTSKIDFVFTKPDLTTEVGRAKATITKSGSLLGTDSATATWDHAKGPDGEALSHKLRYYIEVDGKAHKNFSQDIYVWAKEVTVEAKKEDGGAYADGIAVFTQTYPKLDDGGEPTTEMASTVHERRTGQDGKIVYALPRPQDVTIVWKRPHFLVDGKWTKDQGTKREAKLKKMALKVRLATPRPPSPSDKTKPYKQYVNMAEARNTPSYGSKVKIEVVPTGDYQGEEGDDVFLKAEFGASNSDRTPATNGHAKGTTYQTSTKLGKKKLAVFELELGQAGGDTVTVKVGATNECKDDEVKIENWRLLFYELMAPDCMKPRLVKRTLGNGTDGYDLPDATRTWTTERVAKIFVEYKCWASHIFADAKMSKWIVKGKYLKKTGADETKDFFILGSPIAYDASKDPVEFNAKDSRTIRVRACDVVSDAFAAADWSGRVTAVETPIDLPGAGVYPIHPGDGTASITDVVWKAVGYDATAYPDHPGINPADGTARYGTLPTTAVTLVDKNQFKLKLTGDPAGLVGPAGATKCPIAVWVTMRLADPYNGSAWQGRQLMNLSRPLKAVAATLCHELGHSMGMTIMSTGTYANKGPPGLPVPDAVPTGTYYDLHDHTGGHCADQVTDKTAATFRNAGGKCLMFGEGGDDEEPARANYCATCIKYLKARNLSNILDEFKGRTDTQEY